MGLFKRTPVIDFNEVREYIDDIKRVTLLRDKALSADERSDFNKALAVMREVLIRINTLKKKH